jgi:hypothetical protein
VRSAGNDPAVAILACEHIEAAFGWPLLIKSTAFIATKLVDLKQLRQN